MSTMFAYFISITLKIGNKLIQNVWNNNIQSFICAASLVMIAVPTCIFKPKMWKFTSNLTVADLPDLPDSAYQALNKCPLSCSVISATVTMNLNQSLCLDLNHWFIFWLTTCICVYCPYWWFHLTNKSHFQCYFNPIYCLFACCFALQLIYTCRRHSNNNYNIYTNNDTPYRKDQDRPRDDVSVEVWLDISIYCLPRMRHASRERLPFRTPGFVPLFGTCLYDPIVETSSPKLAVSFLDCSLWMPLGTFSIWT